MNNADRQLAESLANVPISAWARADKRRLRICTLKSCLRRAGVRKDGKASATCNQCREYNAARRQRLRANSPAVSLRLHKAKQERDEARNAHNPLHKPVQQLPAPAPPPPPAAAPAPAFLPVIQPVVNDEERLLDFALDPEADILEYAPQALFPDLEEVLAEGEVAVRAAAFELL